MTPQGNALSALGGAKQVEGLGQWPLHAQRLEEEDALLAELAAALATAAAAATEAS